MIRQPPEYVPSEIALAAGDDDPQRERVILGGGVVAAGDQRQEDHAHRLLRVLEPVTQRQRRGRHRLREPESACTLPGDAAGRST